MIAAKVVLVKNEKIKVAIFGLKGRIHDLLTALGYAQVDGKYVFVGDDFTMIKCGQALIKKAVEDVKQR